MHPFLSPPGSDVSGLTASSSAARRHRAPFSATSAAFFLRLRTDFFFFRTISNFFSPLWIEYRPVPFFCEKRAKNPSFRCKKEAGPHFPRSRRNFPPPPRQGMKRRRRTSSNGVEGPLVGSPIFSPSTGNSFDKPLQQQPVFFFSFPKTKEPKLTREGISLSPSGEKGTPQRRRLF